MTCFKQTAAAYLSATLFVVASCHLSAFEQGTYFIYQLVEESDAQVIDKRLTVNSELFIKSDHAQAKNTPKTEDRSEFEMNYNSFGTTANSGFETTPSTSTEVHTTSESSAFNLSTEEPISLFGN
jgi:hypothetical protein